MVVECFLLYTSWESWRKTVVEGVQILSSIVCHDYSYTKTVYMTRDIQTNRKIFGIETVKNCLNDLCMSILEFEHTTFRKRGVVFTDWSTETILRSWKQKTYCMWLLFWEKEHFCIYKIWERLQYTVLDRFLALY